MTILEIHDYYKGRIAEVKEYSTKIGNPWSFLMCSTFIDYLVKMVNNDEKSGGGEYKKFVRDYLSLIVCKMCLMHCLYPNF